MKLLLKSTLVKCSVVMLAATLLMVSCSDDDDGMMDMNPTNPADPCEGVDPSFSSQIVPILNNSCALTGCHVAGFSSGDFTMHSEFASRAVSAISRMNSGSMPPSSSSAPDPTTAEIQLINCWIEAGSKNN